MQQTQNILSLIFFLNVGAILAAPVDPTVPNITVLMQNISDLRESSGHNLHILHTQMTTNNTALQQQVDTLRGTVDRLNGTVNELGDWKATTEERLSSLETQVQENYDKFYSGIHEVVNEARDLKDVIKQYHPNSFPTTPPSIPGQTDGDNTQTATQNVNVDRAPVVEEVNPVE